MNNQDFKTGEVILYTNPDGSTAVDVRLEQETVWLSQAQISVLFGVDRTVITRHINNIFKSDELDRKSNVQKMHIANADRPVSFYDLDVILSVGYRVNSGKATIFRRWANDVLKQYLLKGYVLNNARWTAEQIAQFQQALSLFPQTVEKLSSRGELNSDEAVALMRLVTNYASSWALLRQYDDGELQPLQQGGEPTFELSYNAARQAIDGLKSDLMSKSEASELFGNERDETFKGVLGNIYQTFGNDELYPSIEHKAAHLLYFVIKDHPFSDGNKRIGALLFLYFLQQNNYLLDNQERSKVDPNTLVALALLVAESDPKQKEIMIALIMHLLQGQHEY